MKNKKRLTPLTKWLKLLLLLATISSVSAIILLPRTNYMFKWNPEAWKWLQDFSNTPGSGGAFVKFGAICWLVSAILVVLYFVLSFIDAYLYRGNKWGKL